MSLYGFISITVNTWINLSLWYNLIQDSNIFYNKQFVPRYRELWEPTIYAGRKVSRWKHLLINIQLPIKSAGKFPAFLCPSTSVTNSFQDNADTEKKMQPIFFYSIFYTTWSKNRSFIFKKIPVSKSFFSSAAAFLRQTGRKVLPMVGNTDTFADRQEQLPRFCHGVDLMSFFEGCQTNFRIVIYTVK